MGRKKYVAEKQIGLGQKIREVNCERTKRKDWRKIEGESRRGG